MRKYELMVVFPMEEDLFKTGTDTVRQTLTEFGAQIISEEPYGERDLTYEIKKRTRGRYLLFNINAEPANIVEIDRQFKLNTNILTFLFIRVEE
ncbi:30S ribosomal protein S6 [Brucepastera parasyntrophica]|uniref:30S ribosomal protein S6 n=1 Tax=Brucepastera parasyntrophica TaxID=2880008 RepID=UPI00210B2E7B|nr:30S ribosomal protein S6 [Brucepastera parasyntrophica]ULQ59956.1 30S ribosomal protein S6 [Brucepastera parasyntrophica]